MLWSAQSGGKDAADAVGKAAQESLQSLSSQDEDEYYMNPNDPTRVRQWFVSWLLFKSSWQWRWLKRVSTGGVTDG